MRLTVLSDNRSANECLKTEHGLSALLDTGDMKVLLDTGASDIFVRNASVLGLDLEDVDYVFLSHAHKDHTGGLIHFLEKNTRARIIVSPDAVKGDYFSSRGGMHCISPGWKETDLTGRIIYADKEMEFGRIRILTDLKRGNPLPKADGCLYKSDGERLVNDAFRHEIALYTDGFLFTGCAHNGILNILEACGKPLHTVMGGFHLLDAAIGDEGFESEDELKDIAVRLMREYPGVTFYTGHCTGDKVYEVMKSIMSEMLQQFRCGMCLEI